MKKDSEKSGKSRLTYEEIQEFISKQLDDIEKNTESVRSDPPPDPRLRPLLKRILQKLKRRRK